MPKPARRPFLRPRSPCLAEDPTTCTLRLLRWMQHARAAQVADLILPTPAAELARRAQLEAALCAIRGEAASEPAVPVDAGHHREVHGFFERRLGPVARLVVAIEEALTGADEAAEAERRRQLGLALDSILAAEAPLPEPYTRERVRELKRQFLVLEAQLADYMETKLQAALRVRLGRLREALAPLEHPERVRYLANRFVVAEEKVARDRTISMRTRAPLVDALDMARNETWRSTARKRAVIKRIEEAIAAVHEELAMTTGQERKLDRELALLAFAEVLAPNGSYEQQAEGLVDLLAQDVSEAERRTHVRTYKKTLLRRRRELTDFCPPATELVF